MSIHQTPGRHFYNNHQYIPMMELSTKTSYSFFMQLIHGYAQNISYLTYLGNTFPEIFYIRPQPCYAADQVLQKDRKSLQRLIFLFGPKYIGASCGKNLNGWRENLQSKRAFPLPCIHIFYFGLSSTTVACFQI